MYDRGSSFRGPQRPGDPRNKIFPQQDPGPRSPSVVVGPEEQVYGEWTVLGLTERLDSSRRRYARCRCSCGIERLVSTKRLRAGKSRSCGHKARLAGRVVGDWLIISPRSGNRWLCRCRHCGGEIVRSYASVQKGPARCRCQREPVDVLPDTIRGYAYAAQRRGLTWSLSPERARELLLGVCVYCDAAPEPRNGIDRVNNALGYEEKNVVSCCKYCNYAKRDRSAAEFLAWARRVAERAA